MDQCTQDWFSVASVCESSLKEIKRNNTEIEECFLRSDNAGCYHSAPLLLSLPAIGRRAQVKIRRYDYSESQNGKDVCDRKIAPMKSRLRCYLNEGNNIVTASDMKSALDSYGGVKGCHIAVCKVNLSRQQIRQHSWSGIQSYSNFEFKQDGGIQMWQAYSIGQGKLLSKEKVESYAVPQGDTALVLTEDFGVPQKAVGMLRKRRENEDYDGDGNKESFHCPETGCVKMFESNEQLQKHLDVGRHYFQLEKDNNYDVIRKRCCEVRSSYTCASETELTPNSCGSTLEKGWALKKTKKGKRFTEPVKSYLLKIFVEGEESGRKATGTQVAFQMKSVRDEDGKKLFEKSDWLTANQITSYFSRLSVLKRKGKLHICADEDMMEALIQRVQRDDLLSDIVQQVEL